MSTETTPEVEVRWKGAERLRAQLVPIDSLKPHPANSNKGDVPAIMKSLDRFGQVRPVLALEDGTIIAGHHVTRGARNLDWTHIATVLHEFETRDDAADYLVADNQLSSLAHVEDDKQIPLLEEIERRGAWEGTGYAPEDLADIRALARHKTELVNQAELKSHERNYLEHGPEQREHLMKSLKEHGFYRNIVVAKDGTVLAGHGILDAAREVGLNKIPVTRLAIEPDSEEALKIIAGDNEMGKLAEIDDRALSEMLKEVHEQGDMSALLGTGYDAQTLAALVMVTRPASEIRDHDAAAEWLGLPGFEEGGQRVQLVISFDEKDGKSAEEWRDDLCAKLDIQPHYKRSASSDNMATTWSTWWPPRPREDLKSLKFTDGDGNTQVRDVAEQDQADDATWGTDPETSAGGIASGSQPPPDEGGAKDPVPAADAPPAEDPPVDPPVAPPQARVPPEPALSPGPIPGPTPDDMPSQSGQSPPDEEPTTLTGEVPPTGRSPYDEGAQS